MVEYVRCTRWSPRYMAAAPLPWVSHLKRSRRRRQARPDAQPACVVTLNTSAQTPSSARLWSWMSWVQVPSSTPSSLLFMIMADCPGTARSTHHDHEDRLHGR